MKIEYIIVHCSATVEGVDFKAHDIDRWHRQERGWNKIGYHYVIDLDGTIEKGRDETEIGAHCQGYNQNSLGICYIGGLNKYGNPADTRTLQQKASMYRLLVELKEKYPNAKIVGHNELNKNKSCPCFDVKKYYAF